MEFASTIISYFCHVRRLQSNVLLLYLQLLKGFKWCNRGIKSYAIYQKDLWQPTIFLSHAKGRSRSKDVKINISYSSHTIALVFVIVSFTWTRMIGNNYIIMTRKWTVTRKINHITSTIFTIVRWTGKPNYSISISSHNVKEKSINDLFMTIAICEILVQ